VNRKDREASRKYFETLRQQRIAEDAKRAELEKRREAGLQAALARKAERTHTSVLGRVPTALRSGKLDQLLTVLEDKAPKLLEPTYVTALSFVANLTPVRPIEAWEPRGKGRETLYRSLCEHLLALYPIPAVFWNAFFDTDNALLYAPLVADVATGKSFYQCAKSAFPVPLTRAMCHELSQTSADCKLTEALRRVQAKAAGTSARFFAAWKATRYARRIGTKDEEAFWQTVLAWFGKIGMFDPNQVGPLLDYIDHRRGEDPSFSMKGRSALAMVRAMREWHGNLTKVKSVKATIFTKSGLRDAAFSDYTRKESSGATVHERWRVGELLTAHALFEEGRRMGHCVYSYAPRIERGEISIWSVTMEDGKGDTGNWAMVTLEVQNGSKAIVQARGRFNRPTTHREDQVILRWAGMNNLVLQTASRW